MAACNTIIATDPASCTLLPTASLLTLSPLALNLCYLMLVDATCLFMVIMYFIPLTHFFLLAYYFNRWTKFCHDNLHLLSF